MNRSPSVSLYNGLCSHTHVGSQKIVQIRREIMDIAEKIHGPIHKYNKLNVMQSGSYREGFRFTSSDQDIMHWLINCKVICEMSQFSNNDAAKLNIILMKHSESPPGFVMLKLLTPTRNFRTFSSSVVVLLKDCYISSKIFRESVMIMQRRTSGLGQWNYMALLLKSIWNTWKLTLVCALLVHIGHKPLHRGLRDAK